MKKFEFRLEPVLKYRRYLERLAQQETARAHMNLKNCENKIMGLKAEYEAQGNKMENAVLDGVSASEFRAFCQYIWAVESGLEEAESEKMDLTRVLDEKIVELKQKSVDKKVMDLYREKQRDRYVQEIIKAEQKELDEISSLKTARALSNEKS